MRSCIGNLCSSMLICSPVGQITETCCCRQRRSFLRSANEGTAASISDPGFKETTWLWWWEELDCLPPRRCGPPAVGAHVVVQGQDQQVPRRGIVTDIVGKLWCHVALDDDESGLSGSLHERPVSEPQRCRTNMVRVLTAAEVDRIGVAAAKRLASLTSDRNLGEIQGVSPMPQSLPLEKASVTTLEDDSELTCSSYCKVTSSKHNFAPPNSISEFQLADACLKKLPLSRKISHDLDSFDGSLVRNRKSSVPETGFEAVMPVSNVSPGDNIELFSSCIAVNSSKHNFFSLVPHSKGLMLFCHVQRYCLIQMKSAKILIQTMNHSLQTEGLQLQRQVARLPLTRRYTMVLLKQKMALKYGNNTQILLATSSRTIQACQINSYVLGLKF